MKVVNPHPSVIRFGVFEVNLESAVLRRNGMKVRLQEKPFQMLAALLENPGEIVSREELRGRLWGDVHVEYEHGLNIVANRLRRALGDSADNPKFVETVPRRGYRFIAPVQLPAGESPTEAADLEGLGETASLQRISPRIRAALWLVGTVAVLALVASGFWKWDTGSDPEFAFQERGWVLVCPFTNETGDALFDGTLEHALERELGNSSFINVVPQERVQDTLKLMQLSPDTPIDLGIAREISLRDGQIRALISGEVRKFGQSYQLTVDIINPANGAVVYSKTETVSYDDAPSVVRELSTWVRNTLGEQFLKERADPIHLEKVSTPSLRAVELYSHAMELVNSGGSSAAEPLLRQAVEEDPNFASAHILLAHAIANQGKPENQWKPFAEEAFRLAPNTSDRERYFIQGSYFSFVGKDEEAIPHYKALVALYPDHYWGVNNLAWILRRMGRNRESVPYWVRKAELRPNSYLNSYRAAHAVAAYGEGFEAAEPFYQRALGLPGTSVAHYFIPPIELYPAWRLWCLQRSAESLQEVERVAETMAAAPAERRDFLRLSVLGAYLSLGVLRRAEEMLVIPADNPWAFSERIRCGISLLRGEKAALLQHARSLVGTVPNSASVILMVKAGLIDEAKEMQGEFRRVQAEEEGNRELTEGILSTSEGMILLALGQTEEAMERFEQAVRTLEETPFSEFLVAAESLAQVHEQQGNVNEAIEVLEIASLQKRASFPDRGWLWLPIRYRLFTLYLKAGRLNRARELEAELEEALSIADPDLWVKRAFETARAGNE